MSVGSLLVLFVIAVLVVGYGWYATIIARRNKALEALAGIDVQLKKRSDLIPNILTIAQKFMNHERSLLNEITELRAKATADYDRAKPADVKEHLDASQQLAGRMGQLMIAVEDYPDLKSDTTMAQAQQTYNEVETQIAAARRFYNSAVNGLNTAIQVFPGNFLAGFAKATVMPSYEAEDSARAVVAAADHLN